MSARGGLHWPAEASEELEGVEEDMEGSYDNFFRLWRPRHTVARPARVTRVCTYNPMPAHVYLHSMYMYGRTDVLIGTGTAEAAFGPWKYMDNGDHNK